MKPLVVIPVYLRTDADLRMTLKAVESCRKTQREGVEILLVDDGSPEPGLVDSLDAQSSRLKFELHRKQENSGFAQTVNVGLERARESGQDAVLMNADMEMITPDWVRRCKATTDDRHERAAVVGALLRYPNGLIQHAGIYFSLLTRDFNHLNKYAPESLPDAHKKRICPVTGAFQYIRNETLQEVGIYDGGFCSPGDELISMSDGEQAPIGDLSASGEGVVAVNHLHAGGRVLVNGPGKGNRSRRGWGFTRSSRQYSGDLIVLQAGQSVSRVTPEHRLRVRWTERALDSWAVYLMRRGQDWRIGTCRMRYSKEKGASGPALRWGANEADALWIVGLHADKDAALLQELSLSLDYQVPTALFRHSELRKQHWLDDFWVTRDSQSGALRLLVDHYRDPRVPLLSRGSASGRGSGRYVGGSYHGFITAATNVMDGGLMTVGTLGDLRDREKRLRREEVAIDREPFNGIVYGLDVPPYHHYISGGISVHNSMGWEDVDYCIRVFQAKKRCVYNPNIRAIHDESMFRGRPDPKIEEWQQKSFMYLMAKYKHLNFAEFVPYL